MLHNEGPVHVDRFPLTVFSGAPSVSYGSSKFHLGSKPSSGDPNETARWSVKLPLRPQLPPRDPDSPMVGIGPEGHVGPLSIESVSRPWGTGNLACPVSRKPSSASWVPAGFGIEKWFGPSGSRTLHALGAEVGNAPWR